MQVIFTFIFFVFCIFSFWGTVLCLWLFFKVFIWHSMFCSSLDLFLFGLSCTWWKTLSVSLSHSLKTVFKWRTKLTKLTPCQLAILAGFKRKTQVIRVTQWRRECKRMWISGQMLTMPDVKLLARSFMASLGLVISLSLSIFLSFCHFLSRWLILCGFLSSGSRRWSSAHDGGGPLHLHSENQSAQCRLAGTSSPINLILVSPTNCAKPSRSSHSLHFTSADHKEAVSGQNIHVLQRSWEV